MGKLGFIPVAITMLVGVVFIALHFSFVIGDTGQFLGLSRTQLAVVSAGGFAMTSLQLAWKLWQATSGRPSFTVVPAARAQRAIRLRVTNTSGVAATVTARGVARYGESVTEAISLIWEETNTERMTLNPDGHGNLHVGEYVIRDLEPRNPNITYHGVQFLSNSLGQRTGGLFGLHLSNDPQMEMSCTLTIGADRRPVGRRVWEFIIRDDHQHWMAVIEPAPEPIKSHPTRMRSVLGKVGLHW